MISTIAEHWMHEPDCPALREFALSRCRDPELVHTGEVEADYARPAPGAVSLDMLICRSVGPHVDDYHPEWSALWVLCSGNGHELHIADRKVAKGTIVRRTPPRKITQTVPLVVGRIVLFNAHRVHWLPPATDGTVLIVANFDFETRPSRDVITSRIAAANRALAAKAIAA